MLDPLGMTETTFWPTAEQQSRLAKAYRPNEARTGMEEIQIPQIRYPLDDPTRRSMPAGGLFSTVQDVVRFCQMILNGGKDETRRYLSPSSVAEVTRRQTDSSLETSYGLGWAVGSDRYGHGGAFATQMNIHPGSGLITVFLVQQAGFLFDGDKSYEAFVADATAST